MGSADLERSLAGLAKRAQRARRTRDEGSNEDAAICTVHELKTAHDANQDLKGFAMPPTPILGSGASFQGPGHLPMASARQAIGIRLIESFWRAIFVEIRPFS